MMPIPPSFASAMARLRLGHGVHRRREHRDVDVDVAGRAGPGVDLGRQDLAVSRNEQEVVVSDPDGDVRVLHDGSPRVKSRARASSIGRIRHDTNTTRRGALRSRRAEPRPERPPFRASRRRRPGIVGRARPAGQRGMIEPRRGEAAGPVGQRPAPPAARIPRRRLRAGAAGACRPPATKAAASALVSTTRPPARWTGAGRGRARGELEQRAPQHERERGQERQGRGGEVRAHRERDGANLRPSKRATSGPASPRRAPRGRLRYDRPHPVDPPLVESRALQPRNVGRRFVARPSPTPATSTAGIAPRERVHEEVVARREGGAGRRADDDRRRRSPRDRPSWRARRGPSLLSITDEARAPNRARASARCSRRPP